jgi:benzoyl-CoA reductase/2-hydroxyglutaryl-CoA dehydratase subunit BcrC/BadD/HgdB
MDAANVVYTESQLNDFVGFLEEQTGSRLDRNKLRLKLDMSRRASDIQTEIYEMRKAVPSPMGAGDAYTVVWPGMVLTGTKACDDFYEKLRAEVSGRVENRIGIVPEEKFRLLWSGLPFWYNMALLNYFEKFGGVVAIENAYFRSQKSLPSQHEDPIKDMAISSTKRRSYAGDIEERIGLTLDIVRDYHIDGVVLAYNTSCRMMYILQPELKNALDRFGIPNVNIECDMADERTYSEGQIKTRLDAFIERMLGAQK